MRPGLGLLACVLAGCVAQPPTATPTAPPSLAMADQQVLRIGIEFLPPDGRLPESEPARAEPSRSAATGGGVQVGERRERAEDPSRTPQLTRLDLEHIEDPIARETMHFVVDLVESDRRRVRREVGIPFFDFRPVDVERGPLLTSEQRMLEEQERWAQDHGTRLLNRPFRLMLRRLPIVRGLELALADFRSDHVPLSEPYRQSHGDRRRLGRLSVRLQTGDLSDPLEIVYIHSALRVGSSQERGKLSLDFDLGKDFNLTFRARHDYETGHTGVRADLIYRPTPRMSVHLAAGDDMEFLSTSSIYSLFESPMDGTPGVVLYAVHTF